MVHILLPYDFQHMGSRLISFKLQASEKKQALTDVTPGASSVFTSSRRWVLPTIVRDCG